MNRTIITLSFLLLLAVFSCSKDESVSKELTLEYSYENLNKSMALWPGLYLEKDSTVTRISIIGAKNNVLNQFFYRGKSDTFWTNVIKQREINGTDQRDTVIETFVAKHFLPDTTKIVVYFMNGFEDSDVTVLRNNRSIYHGNVKFFTADIQLRKKDLKNIDVIVNDDKYSLKIKPDYNFIELIKTDSTLICNYRYYIPIM